MGYWYGEPLSILGGLSTMILEFKQYWKGLPNNIGLNNIRWFLRTPGRFSGFEFEIRTASTYLNRTRYNVEPKFFDPRCGRGEPDIVMVKGNQRFNVQCKTMDPSKSSIIPFDVFRYLVGRIGRLCQDHDKHGYLTVQVEEANLNIPYSRKDMDYIVNAVNDLLLNTKKGNKDITFPGGQFTFNSRPSKERVASHLSEQFIMWQENHIFYERRTLSYNENKKASIVCEIVGGKFPSFQSYVFPILEEAAKSAPKTEPLIICLHLYPPVPVYDYRLSPVIQKSVMPALTEFFNRNRHVCLILISSNAQLPIPVSDTRQVIATPAWEVESQHWSGERPDYYPTNAWLR